MDTARAVDIGQIAQVCHEANRAYCATLGDHSHQSWEKAPDWQRDSAIKGVLFHFQHPNAKPSDSHDSWLAEKANQGWKYGPHKDPVKKEHPCFVPYENLPFEQRMKDYIFSAICKAMLPVDRVVEKTEPKSPPPEHYSVDDEIRANKQSRQLLDIQLQVLHGLPKSRERSLAITKLQECIMWLGMDLKRLGTPNPYPNSKNPTNTIVDPTADGLKL